MKPVFVIGLALNNLLPNGDFESGLSPWKQIGSGVLETDGSHARTGSDNFAFTPKPEGATHLQQFVPLEPGIYELRGFVKKLPGTSDDFSFFAHIGGKPIIILSSQIGTDYAEFIFRVVIRGRRKAKKRVPVRLTVVNKDETLDSHVDIDDISLLKVASLEPPGKKRRRRKKKKSD